MARVRPRRRPIRVSGGSGEGVARDSSARISSPYVSRRQGPKSAMCASSPWVRGGRRARSQSAVRGRITSDSTPRALALSFRQVCRRSYRSRTSSDSRSAWGARWAGAWSPSWMACNTPCAVPVDLIRRHPGQAPQVVGVARGAARELHQRRLSHDLEGRTVHALGLLLRGTRRGPGERRPAPA